MKLLFFICLISLFQGSCKTENKKNEKTLAQEKSAIECTENGCSGIYKGPEFINGEDIAHQFSNTMSSAVGDKLKELYQENIYKKVDFSTIEMTTNGMGSGKVTYKLLIPFKSVNSKCESYTSFDHVGGWNHQPALERRKNELKNVTMHGHQLEISDLKKTAEGLQEYWIQWKNKKTQTDCE